MAVSGIFEEVVELLFHSATLSEQGEVCSLVYDVVEQIIVDQIQTDVLEKTINKQVDIFFKANKATELLKKILCNDDGIALIASFIQTQTNKVARDQRNVEHSTTSIAN